MYACTIPLFVYAAFASSTQLQIGTVATTSILMQSSVAALKPTSTEETVRLAIAITFITGVIQILMGLLRVGFLATLLSWPVMSGFTSASAFIIGVSQLKYFFGIKIASSNSFFPKLFQIIKGLPSLHGPTTLLSLATLACLLLAKSRLRLPKWFPMQLLLIVATTAVSFICDLESFGIEIVGTLTGAGGGDA